MSVETRAPIATEPAIAQPEAPPAARPRRFAVPRADVLIMLALFIIAMIPRRRARSAIRPMPATPSAANQKPLAIPRSQPSLSPA